MKLNTTSSRTSRAMGVADLRERFERLVYMVLSVRRDMVSAAEQLTKYKRAEQERFLGSVESIARASVELAFNYCRFASPALAALDRAAWKPWIEHILDHEEMGC